MKQMQRRLLTQRALAYCGSLIVLACVWALVQKMMRNRKYAQPQGVAVLLVRNCTREEENTRGDSRDVWVRLRGDGTTYINEDKISSTELLPFIEKTMSTRMEKVIYLLGENDIAYQRVAEAAADLQHAIPDLYILLPTTSNVRPQFPCLVPADSAAFRPDHVWNGSISQRH